MSHGTFLYLLIYLNVIIYSLFQNILNVVFVMFIQHFIQSSSIDWDLYIYIGAGHIIRISSKS